MAALTNANVKREIASIGPYKLEFVWTEAAYTSGTYTSDLVRPIASCAGQFTAPTDNGTYTSISGKTVTITVPGSFRIAALTFGF